MAPPRAVIPLLGACALVAFIPTGLAFSLGTVRHQTGLAPTEARAVQRVGSSIAAPTTACGVLALTVLSAAFARGTVRPTRKAVTVRRAEDGSPLLGGMLGAMKQDQEEESREEEAGRVQGSGRIDTATMDQYFDKDIDENDLTEYVKQIEDSQDETAQRLIRYDLYPSKQYILYLAKMNARKMWTRDGQDGKNIGCLEVQIAILTERIRNLVLHAREFKPDYACRVKLTSLVARRRKYLDRLSAKNLDAYMKIREELKIRHLYRMECLRNRLDKWKYATRDRPHAPGRKTLNRLKKAKRLMSNRLANYLRQGKEHKVIHRTQKKLNARRWLARAYDEAAALVNDKPLTTFVDPLNLP
mmetsp:Transcript_19613/g.45621  ORF Transcript_19613/g.45621 Transcript_19613/m.45621 type:complete len:358 (-) Transcript_19613:65-1138(-)